MKCHFFFLFLSLIIPFVALLGCDNMQEEGIRIIRPETVQPIVSIEESTPVRVSDLTIIAIALERYKIAYRGYPISENGGDSWSRAYDQERNLNSDWIVGLVPDFLSALPIEPDYDGEYKKQYVYKSNGANYKILSLRPVDFELVKKKYPELIDDSRRYPAYGYWTERAAGW